jgi:hypothetical protein
MMVIGKNIITKLSEQQQKASTAIKQQVCGRVVEHTERRWGAQYVVYDKDF